MNQDPQALADHVAANKAVVDAFCKNLELASRLYEALRGAESRGQRIYFENTRSGYIIRSVDTGSVIKDNMSFEETLSYLNFAGT